MSFLHEMNFIHCTMSSFKISAKKFVTPFDGSEDLQPTVLNVVGQNSNE